MTWLVHVVGEEWALGSQNVIRREDGTTLLTNPSGMVHWTMPFWFLGISLLVSGLWLVSIRLGRPSR